MQSCDLKREREFLKRDAPEFISGKLTKSI